MTFEPSAISGARVRVILETASPAGRDSVEPTRRALEALGLRHPVIVTAPTPAALSAALLAAVAEGPDLLVVGGGESAVGAAAARLQGSRTVLGVIASDAAAGPVCWPSGDILQAVRALGAGTVAEVDLGRARAFGPGTTAEVRHFLGTASLGRAADVADRPRPRRRLAALARSVAGLTGTPRREHGLGVRLTFPGGDHAPLTVDDVRRLTVTNTGAGLEIRADGDDRTHHLVTRHVRVHTEVPVPVALDGAPALRTPLDIGVQVGALRVVVPAEFCAAPSAGAA